MYALVDTEKIAYRFLLLLALSPASVNQRTTIAAQCEACQRFFSFLSLTNARAIATELDKSNKALVALVSG